MDSDPTPDPVIFVSDLQDGNKNYFNFCCFLLSQATFTSLFKDKKSKKSQNSRNQGFPYYYCLIMDLGGPKTYGSDSESAALIKR